MDVHKHLVKTFAEYIACHYRRPVEVGVGRNWTAATLLAERGFPVVCTDIHPAEPPGGVCFVVDDIWEPDLARYGHPDVIFAIRPAPEMVPPMRLVAERVNADLLVYHLGFEVAGNGGDLIDCGVLIHRYHCRQNSNNDD